MKLAKDVHSLIDVHSDLKKYNLPLMETLNPCQQAYYYDTDNYCITYRIKLDLLNFSRWRLKVPTRVVGFPFSICHQGFKGNLEDVLPQIKGLTVVLNANEKLEKNCGNTLSTYVFENRFKDFESYLKALRSPYRYRINKALKKGKTLKIKTIEPQAFNSKYYKLYEEVFNNSNDQLEKLTLDFFQTYPAEIITFEDYLGEAVGFVQLKIVSNELMFLFGGFNKEVNLKYDLYYNMLLYIIKRGIESKVKTINMGQTADESKIKVGCTEEEKYLYCYHSNRLLNKLINTLIPLFSFKRYAIKHHVFKEGNHADSAL